MYVPTIARLRSHHHETSQLQLWPYAQISTDPSKNERASSAASVIESLHHLWRDSDTRLMRFSRSASNQNPRHDWRGERDRDNSKILHFLPSIARTTQEWRKIFTGIGKLPLQDPRINAKMRLFSCTAWQGFQLFQRKERIGIHFLSVIRDVRVRPTIQ